MQNFNIVSGWINKVDILKSDLTLKCVFDGCFAVLVDHWRPSDYVFESQFAGGLAFFDCNQSRSDCCEGKEAEEHAKKYGN